MKEFSIYYSELGIKQVKPTGTINLTDCANLIRSSESLMKMTNELRADTETRQIKKSLLPYVTFAGTFTKRAVKNLIERSEYFVVDIDHIGNQDQIKAIVTHVCKFFTPAMFFISPSGDGLKVIFQIDSDAGTHLDFFNAFRYFFKKEIGVDIDEACKDVSRACFLCHDENVYLSNNPDILDQEFIFSVPELTEIAIDETARYNNAKKWTDKQITFMEGSRNQYITKLAACCHRFGLSEQFVYDQLIKFAENGFSIQEIHATIKSIYNNAAYASIAEKKINPYVRVGTTFYKIILKTDRHGIDRKELKIWNQATLLQDHKRNYIKNIPHFDDFIMIPDNLQLKPVINNCYNLYSEFRHTPSPGPWLWTERLLKHVFAEQYDLGLRYMQILYLHPDHSTIILCLVSKERGTGKTTFTNWINMIFGSNVALISSTDFLSGFNSHYATKNIVCIEETLFEKRLTIEKLKALATAKYIQINEKFVVPYKIPFYGKIILTSNNEERFAQIDDEEIRFFVRKLGTPEFTNHNIESNLLQEIPAFLDYLQSLPPVDWTVSRSGFTGKELVNQALYNVVLESRSSLAKDLEIEIVDFFNNNELKFFYATAKDIKNKFFEYDNRIGSGYIPYVLKIDFNMQPEKLQRYFPFNENMINSKVGTPYCFKRSDFVKSVKKL